MQIFVIFPDGHGATIEADGTDTVDTFIQKLFENEFVRLQNINDFRLFFSGTRLDTELDKSLSSFDIKKESTLNILLDNKWKILKEKRLLDKRLEQTNQRLEQTNQRLEQLQGLGERFQELEENNRKLAGMIANIFRLMNPRLGLQRGRHISKRKKRKTKRRKKGK